MSSVAIAQVSISWEPSDSLHASGTTTEVDIIAHAEVKNETNEPITILWVRDNSSIVDGWKTKVCDANLCYLTSVSQCPVGSPVTIAAGELSRMDVHLNPNGIQGNGKVGIDIVSADNPAVTIASAEYFFNVSVTAQNELTKNSVKLFPNPTTDYFQLTTEDGIARIEIFNLVGRSIRSFYALDDQHYYIGDLPSGVYLVRLVNDNNRTIKTFRIDKK
ncbi:MAG: T9SS type A sorting domain-containing protein [Saprospiraceae bacterium]|nr:T9SS type A sorting domain-containing protein [Saprospiraceae bacterium]